MTAYNSEAITKLIAEVSALDCAAGKDAVINSITDAFTLVRERKVYTCDDFSVRVSWSKNGSFSNTVLSLSALLKYDSKPFIVILATPSGCQFFLSNTTFLYKISHSSQQLRVDNIKGSFNGSDIMRDYDGIANEPKNFETLFCIHQGFSQEENIERLVEATSNIKANKHKFEVSSAARQTILEAPLRAQSFMSSDLCFELKADLDERAKRISNLEVDITSIDNVNLRGRFIEELLTTDNPVTIRELNESLKSGHFPALATDQALGDYSKRLGNYAAEVDIKSKEAALGSAPKAYNVDKFLTFMADDGSVYFIYVVEVDKGNVYKTKLVSVFDERLVESTVVQFHWAGRDSRGVTQFSGEVLNAIVADEQESAVDVEASQAFLEKLIEL